VHAAVPSDQSASCNGRVSVDLLPLGNGDSNGIEKMRLKQKQNKTRTRTKRKKSKDCRESKNSHAIFIHGTSLVHLTQFLFAKSRLVWGLGFCTWEMEKPRRFRRKSPITRNESERWSARRRRKFQTMDLDLFRIFVLSDTMIEPSLLLLLLLLQTVTCPDINHLEQFPQNKYSDFRLGGFSFRFATCWRQHFETFMF